MAKISPQRGQFKLAATAGSPAVLLGVTKCERKGTAKTYDCTSTDSAGYEEHIIGEALIGNTLSLELFIDTAEAAMTGSGATPPLITPGAGVLFEDIFDTTTPNRKYTGAGTITSCSDGWDIKGSEGLKMTVEILCSGALTAYPSA